MRLCLSVTFAMNRYHGRAGESVLEWPPSPQRLFQALIAGSHLGAYNLVNQTTRDEALRWLERLEPPVIETCTPPDCGQGMVNYVPNNDDGLVHIRTAKAMLAKAMATDRTIAYHWRFSSSSEAQVAASVICAIAALVTHLGQHQDIVYVRGDVTETEPVITAAGEARIVLHPAERADGEWEAPAEGALVSYKERHKGFLNGESPFDYVIPSRSVRYQAPNIISFDQPLALFELWSNDDTRLRFEPRDLRLPAAMVRNAMIEWLEANPSFVSYYGEEMTSRLVCGHEPNQPGKPYNGPHIAFVPIPSFNQEWLADGWIRRVLVIGNGCEDGLASDLFNDAVGNLGGRPLKDNGAVVGYLRRAESDTRDSVLRLFVRSEQPCRVWRTATPIVFTGLTRRGRPSGQLIARALKQAGIAETDIDSVATFRGPIIPKTVHALDYRVDGYLAETPRYHAEVIFNRPVIGPLVVGRGRHCGFGLMFPWAEEPAPILEEENP